MRFIELLFLTLCKLKQSLLISAARDTSGWGCTPQAQSCFMNWSSQSNLASFSQPNGLFGQLISWANSDKSCASRHSFEATDDFRPKSNVFAYYWACLAFSLFSGSQVGGKGVISPQRAAALSQVPLLFEKEATEVFPSSASESMLCPLGNEWRHEWFSFRNNNLQVIPLDLNLADPRSFLHAASKPPS